MTLRRVKRIYATCDSCEQEHSVGHFEDAWASLESTLRDQGWQIGRLGVFCPHCRSHPKRELK